MWADILTKLLQGAKFRVMRAGLMKCPLEYCENEHTALNIGNMHTLIENHPTDLPLQGCVGTQFRKLCLPDRHQRTMCWRINDTCDGKRPSSTSIIDDRHQPSNRRSLFKNNLGLQSSTDALFIRNKRFSSTISLLKKIKTNHRSWSFLHRGKVPTLAHLHISVVHDASIRNQFLNFNFSFQIHWKLNFRCDSN